MKEISIERNVKEILSKLPQEVQLVAACKTRTPEEIQKVIDAGVVVLGENYVQEAEEAYHKVTGSIKWHLIGHLQRNKVKRAIKIFDMVESLDSIRLAKEINNQCSNINRVMECLVEVNSGREKHKYGIMPEEVESFIEKVSCFENIRVMGLMTMGPLVGEPEEFRPYFNTTKEIFNQLKSKNISRCSMKYLSMGMSSSYEVAIDEGANLVRIGTTIFGARE